MRFLPKSAQTQTNYVTQAIGGARGTLKNYDFRRNLCAHGQLTRSAQGRMFFFLAFRVR